jgi:ubiquinone biosynthesis accessory factor UbiK
MALTPNQLFNTLNEHFGQLLPDIARSAQEDVHNHVKAVVNSVLARLDLVTREEFEIQLEVLRRTRAKVDALEKRVADLEGLVTAAAVKPE